MTRSSTRVGQLTGMALCLWVASVEAASIDGVLRPRREPPGMDASGMSLPSHPAPVPKGSPLPINPDAALPDEQPAVQERKRRQVISSSSTTTTPQPLVSLSSFVFFVFIFFPRSEPLATTPVPLNSVRPTQVPHLQPCDHRTFVSWPTTQC